MNEGTTDRIFRIVVGLIILSAYFWLPVPAPYIYAVAIGFIPLLTGLIGYCPVYSILGFSTKPARKR